MAPDTAAPSITKRKRKSLVARPKANKSARTDEKEERAEGEQADRPAKRRKREKVEVPASIEAAPAETEEPAAEPEKKRRFILFVGNLSFDATVETIAAHFAACGERPSPMF